MTSEGLRPLPLVGNVYKLVADRYREIVLQAHPNVTDWPILSGFDVGADATFGSAVVLYFVHTGANARHFTTGFTSLNRETVGVDRIDRGNKYQVAARLEAYYRAGPRDLLLVLEDSVRPDNMVNINHASLDEQLRHILRRHEMVTGLLPTKLFLSHKGIDKPRVREYFHTLKLLGFDPWLDEDAMTAGTNLERGILKGMEESCAAIFFVTTSYRDEKYLGAEVDYAIQQKRAKADQFEIITLVLQDGGQKGEVPRLLQPYVWKEPANDLEALRDILKALPLKVGAVRWGG